MEPKMCGTSCQSALPWRSAGKTLCPNVLESAYVTTMTRSASTTMESAASLRGPFAFVSDRIPTTTAGDYAASTLAAMIAAAIRSAVPKSFDTGRKKVMA